MRQIYLTLILILKMLLANAQQQSTGRNFRIDTLYSRTDSTLVKITRFDSDSVKETYTAFLIPDCIKVGRFILFGRSMLKKQVYAPQLIYHGQSIEYKKNGRKIITEYQHGEKLSSLYFDRNSMQISEKEFKTDEGPNFTMVNEHPHIILTESGTKRRCP